MFVERSTYVRAWHMAFFIVKTRHTAVAKARPGFPKMPLALLAFPPKGMHEAPGDKISPFEEVYTMGWQPPEARGAPVLVRVIWIPASRNPCQRASTDYHRKQDIPNLIRVAVNMAVSQPSGKEILHLKMQHFITLIYLYIYYF